MEQLKQLKKEDISMREYAKDVEYAITCVALASDKDDAGNIIFPEKKDVIETLAGASCKLNELVAHIFSQIWGKSRKLTFRRPKKSSKR